MNILVTGAAGFVGRNLVENLKNIRDGKNRTRPQLSVGEIFEYDLGSTEEELKDFCKKADFVFNLAGVNRPEDPALFQSGNFGFASLLLDTLKECENRCPVMLSSSIQASLAGRFGTSEYGLSKRDGEELFFRYAKETGAPVYVYRFPNLVGKWVRPNYNSAVGTFCHNIANGLPIKVNDPSVELELLFIDDLIEEMYDALEGHPHRAGYIDAADAPEALPGGEDCRKTCEPGGDDCQNTLEPGGDDCRKTLETGGEDCRKTLEHGGDDCRKTLEHGGDDCRKTLEPGGAFPDPLTPVPAENGRYCYVPVTHKATLGRITELLYSFREQPETLLMPAIPAGSFEKKLYSMYLSYLPKEKAVFDLKMNCDERGSFTELLKTAEHGQFSVNISRPGITKGQHWHNSKWELFIVVSGRGLIRERKIGTDPATQKPYEPIEFEVCGKKLQAVHMLPGYTHSIINLSDTEDLVTLMWANEIFDPDRPDTFSEPV